MTLEAWCCQCTVNSYHITYPANGRSVNFESGGASNRRQVTGKPVTVCFSTTAAAGGHACIVYRVNASQPTPTAWLGQLQLCRHSDRCIVDAGAVALS